MKATEEVSGVKLYSIEKDLKVLVYHSVSDVDNFKKQVGFLKHKYQLITLSQLKGFIHNQRELPPRALMITFDDGDFSLYKNAFPILRELEIPATIFVITELLNTNRPFWWDEIMFYLGTEEGNKKVWEVKEWRNQERMMYLSSLRKNRIKASPSSRQLNSKEVLEMHNAGLVIANHSHSHPMFNQCSGSEIEDELEASIEVLDSLGLESKVFAYPNGNFSALAENILLKHQFRVAFLFDHKINRGNVHPLRISRLVVNDTTPLWKLKFILSGWHSRLLPFSRRLGKLLN